MVQHLAEVVDGETEEAIGTPIARLRAMSRDSASSSPGGSGHDLDINNLRARLLPEKRKMSVDGEFEGDGEVDDASDEEGPPPLTWKDVLWYMGPGWMVAIAYVDPGNYQADISSGKLTAYSQNWVILWTSLLSIYIQVLCVRLAQRSRQTLSQAIAEEYPRFVRYTLYAVAEFTVMITDLPEVIGFGFAVKLFLGWPIWVGVILSLVTTMLFLSSQHYGFRVLEFIIMCFVGVMSVAIFYEWGVSKGDSVAFLKGAFLPGLSGIPPDYLTVLGIIGCVVMPHNLYLHSAAAMTRGDVQRTEKYVNRAILLCSLDIVLPVLVTVAINYGIVSLAARSLYKNPDAEKAGIGDFCQYFVGLKGGCVMWGIALLAAAQSSAITTTYAGQYVMDGFLNLKMAMWKRAILTRVTAIGPSVIVAVMYDAAALQFMIDLVNAALALLLPFALIPLVKFNTSRRKMGKYASKRTESIILWIMTAAVVVVNIISLKLDLKGRSQGFNFHREITKALPLNMLLVLYVCILSYIALEPVKGKQAQALR